MDSYKTATALAPFADTYERIQDLRFTVAAAPDRLRRVDNDLRKRLRTIRRRGECGIHARAEIARVHNASDIVRKTVNVERRAASTELKRLEPVLANMVRVNRVPDVVHVDVEDDPIPPKRRRLINTMTSAVFDREDIVSVIMPFLHARHAFTSLAPVSKRMQTLVQRWIPRMASRKAIVPPHHLGDVDRFKGLTEVRAPYVRDLAKLAPRLRRLEMYYGDVYDVMLHAYPNLERLVLNSGSPVAFWNMYRPANMPNLRSVELAWNRTHATGHHWVARVRAMMDEGTLGLTSFVANLHVHKDVFDDYMHIHRMVGTNALTVVMVAGMTVEDIVARVGPAVVDLTVRATTMIVHDATPFLALPGLRTLRLVGAQFMMREEDDIVDNNIHNLFIQSPYGNVMSVLRHMGRSLKTLSVETSDLRTILVKWKTAADLPCLDTVETLRLRSSRRIAYSVPFARLPALRTLTLENLSDTQAYCCLAEAGPVGNGLVVRMPGFVSNRVGSMLMRYERDERCTSRVEVDGFQSEFYVAELGADRMCKILLV
jgi:hypothetical protein